MENTGGVFLSKNDQWKFSTINDFLHGKLSRNEAAKLVALSVRQVSRIARKIAAAGIIGLIHGNFGRRPVNKHSSDFKEQVMATVERNYFDFNVTHCREKLAQVHGISVSHSTLLRWCSERNLVKRRCARRPKIRRCRERMPNEGLLLQFDGSHHKWNGKDEWCLIGAIDDATSDIPYAEFFSAEDTLSCMVVIQKIVEKNGIPHALYVDKAGWFGGTKRQKFSQFKRACEELGIRIIFANSPQAKGRIERAWNTFQDRLIPEMRLRNIHRMPAANNYLQEQFIPDYWAKELKVQPRDLDLKYRPLPIHINLREVFCIKETRVVNSNETISYDSVFYNVKSDIPYSLRRQKIEIRTYQDMTWKAFHGSKEVTLTPLVKLRKYGT